MTLRVAALAALALVPLGACSPPPRPHVLLLTADTLRPDYMSANGYDRATTPFLDSLIAEGFYFEQAIAPVGRTTPSLASLLTGAYPHRTGVRRLTDPLADDVDTLAELLGDRGYRTLAVVTNQVLTRERRLDRGFAVYDVASDTRGARATTDAALAHLASLDGSAPVFAWVHYIDPHVPYHSDPAIAKRFDPDYQGRYQLHFGWNGDGTPGSHRTFPPDLPKGEATHRNPLPPRVNAHIRRLYAADIRLLDDEARRLVTGARARLGDDLLIVFTADHGESLGEHDFYFDHGDYAYQAETRVPLAFVLPASHPLHGAGRCRGWVSLVDVVPTLAELLGTPLPPDRAAQVEGRSLVPCLRGEPLAVRPVFAESGYSYYFDLVRRRQRNDVAGRFRAVVAEDWKLIWTPFLEGDAAWELYDLAEDPSETRNLYRPDHPRVPELKQKLRDWLARARDEGPARALSEQDVEALRALGYLDESSTPPAPTPLESRRRPTD